MLGWHAIFGGWRNVPLDQEGHDAPDWMAFGIISAGIVLHMIVIGWAGFIIAGTLLFVLIARGFGSRRRYAMPSSRSCSPSWSIRVHAGAGIEASRAPLLGG